MNICPLVVTYKSIMIRLIQPYLFTRIADQEVTHALLILQAYFEGVSMMPHGCSKNALKMIQSCFKEAL